MTEVCDCTALCGDDPRVREGKVEPCKFAQRQQDAAAQFHLDMIQLRKLRKRLDGEDGAALSRILARVTP